MSRQMGQNHRPRTFIARPRRIVQAVKAVALKQYALDPRRLCSDYAKQRSTIQRALKRSQGQ